jgi:transcriptional regulator with XRE-family HTH domain
MEGPGVTRVQDLHPDDAEARVKLRLQLRDLRRRSGLTAEQTAHNIGCTIAALYLTEQRDSRILLERAQRHARGLHHQLILHPTLPHTLPPHPTEAAFAAMADTGGRLSDEHHRAAVLTHLVAYRRWIGLSARDIAERCGNGRDGSSTSQLEAGLKPALLSTLQRYTRALGGVLHIDLEPLPNEQD